MTIMLMLGAALLAPASSATGSLTIEGIAAPNADGMIPLSVAGGDLDGDGVADQGTLLIRCDGGNLAESLIEKVQTAREAGSGLATGRVSQYDKASPQLAKVRPHYDLATLKGARLLSKKGYDAYMAIALSSADGLCAAAATQAGTVRATKTRSNIQNN